MAGSAVRCAPAGGLVAGGSVAGGSAVDGTGIRSAGCRRLWSHAARRALRPARFRPL